MARDFKSIEDDIRSVACDIYVQGLPSDDADMDRMAARHRLFAYLKQIHALSRELGMFGLPSTDHLEEGGHRCDEHSV